MSAAAKKTLRLETYGPLITPEMRAIRADELAAQVEVAGGVLTIRVGSGICHCGEDAEHGGWDAGHSPVEMMEDVQVNAVQVEALVRGIQKALNQHQHHSLPDCGVCRPLRDALRLLSARSV